MQQIKLIRSNFLTAFSPPLGLSLSHSLLRSHSVIRHLLRSVAFMSHSINIEIMNSLFKKQQGYRQYLSKQDLPIAFSYSASIHSRLKNERGNKIPVAALLSQCLWRCEHELIVIFGFYSFPFRCDINYSSAKWWSTREKDDTGSLCLLSFISSISKVFLLDELCRHRNNRSVSK